MHDSRLTTAVRIVDRTLGFRRVLVGYMLVAATLSGLTVGYSAGVA